MKKRPSILIVEDDEDLSQALSEIIHNFQFIPITANTIPLALIKINNQTFDAILLDLCLKNASGLKFVQQIRRNYLSRNHDTPIILHSGHIQENVLDQQKIDIDDAIVKPANIELLQEKLIYWSQRRHTPAANTLSIFITSRNSQRKSG